MLIRFSVANFRSFYSEAVFSMLPGRAKQFSSHILQGHSGHGIDVLRAGMLYGANASGKSNLIKALDFVRTLVIDGTKAKKPIRIEPFRLAIKDEKKLSRFECEIIVNEQAYAYGFELDRQRIHEEWLYKIGKNKDDVALFERVTDKVEGTQVKFPHPKLLSSKDEQFRQFVATGTRPNQLFLTTSIDHDLSDFEPIYNWFAQTLQIIYPDSKPKSIEIMLETDEKFEKDLSKFLSEMNTGIKKICLNRDNIDKIPLPREIIDSLIDDLQKDAPGEKGIIFTLPNDRRYIISLNEATGNPEIASLGAVHIAPNGREITFDIFQESDGTQRLVELFPILYSAKNKVFIIDELERSLHPNLVKKFIKNYIGSKPNSQLIVSTHESTLLDLELVRRDAIWFVEKSPQHESTLYSLDDFKPRPDLDIRKGYLHGRYGAVPVLGSNLGLKEVSNG